jgi:aspartate aminotransferase
VKEVLSRPELKKLWFEEVAEMANRMKAMRTKLRGFLEDKYKSEKSWEHITSQIGMFCYTGLSAEQVERIKNEYSVYMTKDGRASVAGINEGNVEYLAQAIHAVTKQ